MDPQAFFDKDYMDAAIESLPHSVHIRAATFVLAQSLLDVDASLEATLTLAEFLLAGEPV